MTQMSQRAGRFRFTRLLTTDGGLMGRVLAAQAPKRIFRSVHPRIQQGSITLRLPDGSERKLGGHAPGPQAYLHVHRWRMLRRFLLGGALGFSQSYLDGDWDSPAPEKIIELAALNRRTFQTNLRGKTWLRALNNLPHLLRPNTRRGSRRNIEFHYDLGNAFYQSWLDPSMTYSSALFGAGENSLEAAQKAKYRALMDALDIQPGEHVLEIGCGWGGFAELAARERGAKVTGITLSREQLAYAQKRIAGAGLSDQVDFHLTDYRDVTGRFDKIASIEMIEAVGERYWPSYFSTLKNLLKPGGRAGIQAITIDPALYEDYRRKADFIQTYIFPGGMLPTVDAIQAQADANGLKLISDRRFGQSYGETLKRWRDAFDRAFADGSLPEGFDEHFHRLWRYYLCYCEGGFRAGSIDVGQYVLKA